MEDYNSKLFLEQLENGKNAYKNLASTYGQMVIQINNLNTRVRKQMNNISEIEEGLDSNLEENSIQQVAQSILEELDTFNSSINENLELFKKCISESLNFYTTSLQYYKQEKSELSALIKARKTVLFLEALMRKFKNKVIGVQTGLNVLPAFTEQMRHSYKAFEKNAIKLIVELKNAEGECLEAAKLMESKIQVK
ncbi:hypothetical protein [Acidiluteibacter ferrifornacis]|uniref:Uncharacterized protein n=1 Tax=Acidiluteibacter ferrifornacis TaxID=2692424 RepID=A0A6N9NK26_9FLAO|nr:hypothetical protein [Acidiluteibacter ferrifornacis]MBR9833127.1 hypothetical protein [bacterium]NBG66224.1 hypothetical protein [Acidiluteibacter ferrifornacis]